MINARILREAENASVPIGVNKQVGSEQKLPRLKTKALGDVQNTLYSRPANGVNSNTNSVKKNSHETSNHEKLISAEKLPRPAKEKKVGFTPTKSIHKSLSSDNLENMMCEIHNHKLCEEEESCVNSYFEQYKFSEDHINNLIRSVKVYLTPLSIQLLDPCEDIKIPNENDFEESIFSINDIFSDMIVPQIPPPLEI